MGYRRQGKQCGLHFMCWEMKLCLNTDHGLSKSCFSHLFGNYEIHHIYMYRTLSPEMFTTILDLDCH